MNGKRIFAIVAVVVLLFVSLGFRFASTVFTEFMEGWSEALDTDSMAINEQIIEEGDMDEKIAVIQLNGVIQDLGETSFLSQGYNHQQLLQNIEQAGEDDSVKAVLLEVDSPGGGVYETAQIYKKLMAVKEAGKPIYVSMGNMAASGGYYAAMPAEKIFATTSTITGSIGVIMESINYGELAENYGVKFDTIKSGKHKDIMSANRDMTDEEHDILQSMIDEMYGEFVDVVSEGRDMDEETVRKLADGRIYTGSQAVDNGLADELGDEDEALMALKEAHDLKNASVVSYGLEDGLFNLFGFNLDGLFNSKTNEISELTNLLRQTDKPRAMYIY